MHTKLVEHPRHPVLGLFCRYFIINFNVLENIYVEFEVCKSKKYDFSYKRYTPFDPLRGQSVSSFMSFFMRPVKKWPYQLKHPLATPLRGSF